jgi:hypothetical protein
MFPLKTDGKTLAEAEKFLSNQTDKEYLYIFDTKGLQLAKIKGVYDQTQIPLKYLPLLPDAIITHNHPQGSSFSLEDVENAVAHNAKEIRVVTSKFVYSLKREDERWDIDLGNIETQELYNACVNMTINDLKEEIRTRKVTIEEAENKHAHLVWLFFFATFNVSYRKISHKYDEQG